MVNHENLADGVATTLEELSDDMGYWNKLIEQHGDGVVNRCYIIEPYVIVLEFLTEIFTEWSKSSWKRFVNAFDEKAFQKIFSEREYSESPHPYTSPATDPNTITRPHSTLRETMDLGNLSRSTSQDESFPRSHYYSRREILHLLAPILNRYQSDMQSVMDITSTALNISIDNNVGTRIENWTTCSHPDSIWIQGPHAVSHPSQNMLTAICLVALSNRNEIPCVSYFCSLRISAARGSSVPSCRKMLLDMVKSIIVQLILLIPEEIFTEVDFSPSRFEMLTSPGMDVNAALALLRDIREFTPPYLHFVVEGSQELEDRGDIRHTQNLRRTLYELTKSSKPVAPGIPAETQESEVTRVIKTCFTSEGYVDVLAYLVESGYVDKVEYAEEADH